MAKIDRVQEVNIDLLRPYQNNAKIHSDEQVNKIAESIKEFGFLNPCLIDGDYNIIAGHGRVIASKKLGLATVPCVFVEGLTDAQRRAYILADNRLTEMGDWDEELLNIELAELDEMNFDIDLTGFAYDVENDQWFENRQRYDNDNSNETEEYQEFVEKFEQKKTTDDCYTPDEIYEVVADWVEEQYGYKRDKFIRPFYPNGDYQAETYPVGSVVVDNPPFSIMSEILNFYAENKIKFFLFCPALTGMSETQARVATLISVGESITYENGAIIPTSFTTNLEDPEVMAKTCPELAKRIVEADRLAKEKRRIELPKYTYPSSVITQAMLNDFAHLGIQFELMKKDCTRVSGLDSQKESGKAIFGGGLLLSEKARIEAEKARIEAEKARIEAEKAKPRIEWELSEREKELIRSMEHV